MIYIFFAFFKGHCYFFAHGCAYIHPYKRPPSRQLSTYFARLFLFCFSLCIYIAFIFGIPKV